MNWMFAASLSAVFAALFLSESLTWMKILGSILIAGGALLMIL